MPLPLKDNKQIDEELFIELSQKNNVPQYIKAQQIRKNLPTFKQVITCKKGMK